MTLARCTVAGVVMALAGAAVVLPASAAVAAAPSGPTAQAWYRQVLADVRPLQSTLPGALAATSGWASGSESAEATRRELTRAVPTLERVRRTLAALPALEGHRTARDDYAAGMGLYVEALRIDQAATNVPPGPLRVQLQQASRRVRQLGDVVFDQGTAELAPLLGTTLAGPDVAAASRVPDWSSAGVAPAPPLVSAWRGGSGTVSGTQPRASWEAEVGMDGAPSQARVQAALRKSTRRSALAATAVALGAAEDYLGSVPAPASDPLASNRQRLGLLTDAEGLLSAEAGRLSRGAPGRALAAAASSLVQTGARLRAES